MIRFLRRLLWLLIFLAGLLPALALVSVALFLHDIPRLFWGVLYDDHHQPGPGWAFAWWLAYCGAQGNRA